MLRAFSYLQFTFPFHPPWNRFFELIPVYELTYEEFSDVIMGIMINA